VGVLSVGKPSTPDFDITPENAVKYSPENSSIEVCAFRDDSDVRVQCPESVSGTGLGLSISKGIVEAHNGQIHDLERVGGGTILEVELPLYK
jgi:signal transduction histidine kinase